LHERWLAPASRDYLKQARPRVAERTVQELGSIDKAGTRDEAARADIVFIAVNWTSSQHRWPDFQIESAHHDANNPIEPPLFKPFDLRGACRAKSSPILCRARGS